MIKRDVVVIHQIVVEIDETKFTPEFLAEFRASMYPFFDVDDHIEHLAQLHARGIADNGDFVEGYGKLDDFGVKFSVVFVETEIDEVSA